MPVGTERVVIAHGAMDRAAGFVKVGRHLRDLDVVRFDRRGYGRSQDAGVSNTYDDQVDDLLAVIDDQPSVVVGHSMGGVVALATAARRPDLVRAVLAFEAPMPWESWSSSRLGDAPPTEPRAAVDSFMTSVIGSRRWEALPAATREQRYRDGVALLADIDLGRDADAPFDASRISVPVVAAHGSLADARHIRGAVELARRAPQGELVTIDDAGHMAPATHPEAFAELVRRTVARADACP